MYIYGENPKVCYIKNGWGLCEGKFKLNSMSKELNFFFVAVERYFPYLNNIKPFVVKIDQQKSAINDSLRDKLLST